MFSDSKSTNNSLKKQFAKGVALMLLACVALSSLSAFAKISTEKLSSMNVSFYQFFIALIVSIPYIFKKGIKKLEIHSPWLHLIRGISGFFAFYLMYLSLNSITLVDAVLLNNTAPLFVPIILWIFFKTKLNGKLWLSLIIGFIGVILILNPQPHALLKIGAIPALVSGISAAIAFVAVRRLTIVNKIEAILFYYFCFCSVFSALILTITNSWQLPLDDYLALFGGAICLFLFQYFLAKAFLYGLASRLAPFLYAAILFSGVIGWVVWSQVPSLLSVIGGILVIIGAIFALLVGHVPQIPTQKSE